MCHSARKENLPGDFSGKESGFSLIRTTIKTFLFRSSPLLPILLRLAITSSAKTSQEARISLSTYDVLARRTSLWALGRSNLDTSHEREGWVGCKQSRTCNNDSNILRCRCQDKTHTHSTSACLPCTQRAICPRNSHSHPHPLFFQCSLFAHVHVCTWHRGF